MNLDYNNIDEIGQAFAHELYVVFHEEHPEIINNLNAGPYVKKMINHVLLSRK